MPGDPSTRVIHVSVRLLVVVVITALSSSAHAETPPARISDLCDRAARKASAQSGVPLDVLLSISRVETGRTAGGEVLPWPWTVNMEGQGHWFHTEDEARAFVFSRFKSGARSFDIGCYQINYRWHGSGFNSIDEMFDPVLNARYAAEFLDELFAEFGNWPAAAGAYHSRTERHATRYTSKFEKMRTEVIAGGTANPKAQPDTLPARSRPTGGILASAVPMTHGQTRLGSLVPMSSNNGPRLAGN